MKVTTSPMLKPLCPKPATLLGSHHFQTQRQPLLLTTRPFYLQMGTGSLKRAGELRRCSCVCGCIKTLSSIFDTVSTVSKRCLPVVLHVRKAQVGKFGSDDKHGVSIQLACSRRTYVASLTAVCESIAV